MSYKILRPIAILVLFFFSWTFLGIYNLAYALKSSDELRVASSELKAQKPEEKLQKGIEDITQTIERVKKVKTHEELQDEKGRLRQKRQEIEGHDVEIKKQFAETEEKIKGLPDEIKQRHKDFVKKYEENLNILRRNLDDIEKAETKSEIDSASEKIKAHLEKTKPPSRHIPLDPNKLPHRKAEPTKKKPRLKKEDFEQGHGAWGRGQEKPILLASIGDLQGILTNTATQALAPPTQADLSETIEIQFTQDIKDLATQLQNNPVKIYEWVRNNIEYVPTYGSIQGASMCLQTKQCNAFDTASLLIALLRTSNIPAKYVYGTIELPIDKVMNWVGGFTDANSALDFIASGGIPANGLISGGKLSAAQMEHVWVEAYTGYGPYSGRPSRLNSPKTWIPLDPSFKQYNYTQGIDLQAAVPFDAQGFLNQIKSTATINEAENYVTNVDSNYIQTTLTSYQAQLQNYINQNMPNATAGDIIGKKEIKKQELGILPATLPYKKIATGSLYSQLPDNLRHKITFEIQDPYLFQTSLSYTASLPELVGKRITLSYAPATTSDEQIISSYGGIYNVPAYLVNLKPQIKIEGVVKAIGSSVGLGNEQTFDMRFTIPNYGPDIVSNKITAGAYYGIGLNPNKIPKKLIEQRKSKLESVKDTINQSNIYTDDYIGELLYTTAAIYFFELDAFESIFASSYKIANIKHVSEGIVAKDLSVLYSFGIPIKANEGSMFIDVDRYVHSPVSKTGDKTKEQQFMLTVGQMSSGMEHGIFEQLYKKTGTSAVKALSVANNHGIPIYTINKDNIGSILPVLQVSSEVKIDIQNAVNAGKVATVSKTNVTVDTWTGVGYVLLNPNTGAGAYMISGGFAGGGADVKNNETLSSWQRILLIIAGILTVVGAIMSIDWILFGLSAALLGVNIFEFLLLGVAWMTPLWIIGYVLLVVILIIVMVYLMYLIYESIRCEIERCAFRNTPDNTYVRNKTPHKKAMSSTMYFSSVEKVCILYMFL